MKFYTKNVKYKVHVWLQCPTYTPAPGRGTFAMGPRQEVFGEVRSIPNLYTVIARNSTISYYYHTKQRPINLCKIVRGTGVE